MGGRKQIVCRGMSSDSVAKSPRLTAKFPFTRPALRIHRGTLVRGVQCTASAVHGSISDPQRESRYIRSSGKGRRMLCPPQVRTASAAILFTFSITVYCMVYARSRASLLGFGPASEIAARNNAREVSNMIFISATAACLSGCFRRFSRIGGTSPRR